MTEHDRPYSVYKHTSPSNKVYIGITKQKPELRWHNGHGYKSNIHFNNAIKKYGWDNFKHEILFDGLTKDEAEKKEIELIAKYNSTNTDLGYNVDYGGHLRAPVSEETKQKLAIANLGKTYGEETRRKRSESLKGRIITKEHAEKISKALKGKKRPEWSGKNHHMYGKHHTQETKDKISASKTGKPGHPMSEENKKKLSERSSKPVLQYTLDGEFIKEWKSATDAAREYNTHASDISGCCNDKIKTSNGFIWRHKGDELKQEDVDKHKPYHYQERAVEQYSLNGEFIKKYKSIKAATEENRFNNDSNICLCCNGKSKTAYGYIWKYEGEKLVLSNHVNSSKRRVLQYSRNKEFICEYNSITDASNKTGVDGGGITKCCKGQLNRAGNYIWRYADENK